MFGIGNSPTEMVCFRGSTVPRLRTNAQVQRLVLLSPSVAVTTEQSKRNSTCPFVAASGYISA